MKFVSTVAAAALLVSAISQPSAASLHRKYAYFTVHGNTAADLDRELQRRGPFLESDREHHAGAATMHFDTTVKYGLTGKTCRIVKADVTLQRDDHASEMGCITAAGRSLSRHRLGRAFPRHQAARGRARPRSRTAMPAGSNERSGTCARRRDARP